MKKCNQLHCNKDAKCLGMCLRHYEQMGRLGRIIATELEMDHMVWPLEKRWWSTLPEQSELAKRICG